MFIEGEGSFLKYQRFVSNWKNYHCNQKTNKTYKIYDNRKKEGFITAEFVKLGFWGDLSKGKPREREERCIKILFEGCKKMRNVNSYNALRIQNGLTEYENYVGIFA